MPEVLYGRNPVLESLRAGRRSHLRLLVGEGAQATNDLQEMERLARSAGAAVRRLARPDLDRLVGHRHHQGVALESSGYPYVGVDQILTAARASGEPPFLLLLDLVQDPQNAGSLLRTAEVVGVHGVILQERRAVGVTPAVVNASSGASEHLSIARETNLARIMRRLQQDGVWLYGMDGRPESTPYHEADLSGPIGLVVGSEGAGLRRLVRERCDVLIRLPMRGRIESLNAAVAGSVALYAVWRCRGFGAR